MLIFNFFFYAWLLSAWTGSGKYMFPSNICMYGQWTNTITDSGPSQGQNVATSQLLLTALCVCGCVCVFLQLLYSEDQNAHFTTKATTFFSVVDSFGSCFHLPLWSFFPLVFFFLPGWEGLLPGLLSAHLQLITWLLHLRLKSQSPDRALRQSLVSLQRCLLGSVFVLVTIFAPRLRVKT